MSKIIQLSVLVIYMVTSCMVVGKNHWKSGNDQGSNSFVEKLISVMTIPVNDSSEGDSEIPMLFKDPSEDSTLVPEYYLEIAVVKPVSFYNYFYSENKIKDPFRNIFSPPPQSV